MISPQNINPLALNGFRFYLDRCPNTMFFLEAIQLPSISLNSTSYASPFHQMPKPGHTLEFGQLDIQCKWDENAQGWLDIWNWLEDLARHNMLCKGQGSQMVANNVVSDGRLEVLNTARQPIIEYNFESMFPTTLGNGELSIAEDAPAYSVFTTSFSFSNMIVKSLV